MDLFELLHAFWEFIVHIHGEYEPFIKFVSYIVSPILALLAFRANRKDKTEIIEQSSELGKLSNEVENAHRSVRDKQHELELAAAEIGHRGAEIQKLEDDLRRITEGSQALWKLRDVRAFPQYLNWLRDPKGAKIVTIGNLKGGVGKTTIAANFAAYISETRNAPVLLVDLDYQGSLSNMMMLAIEREEVESKVDRLFAADANLVTLEGAKEHLTPKLNRGWLVPANYGFSQLENQLLLKWLLKADGDVDVRFRLAHALLRPEVRNSYAAIILDMPPRMTLGAINALVASHKFFVPTVLDKISAEAVAQFIVNMQAIKKDLKLDIDLAGIIGCMTRNAEPSSREQQALQLAREGGYLWKEGRDYVLKATLPRRVGIGGAAGEDVAYCVKEGARYVNRDVFDPLFAEMCAELFTDDQ
jgi:cellulose biosynthesis protein BcsQ